MRKIGALLFALSLSLGWTSLSFKAYAAEYYDNAQLNYIFKNTKYLIEGNGAVCLWGGKWHKIAKMQITFKGDGALDIKASCNSGQDVESKGKWEIGDGRICLTIHNREISHEMFKNSPTCKRVKKGRFGIELYGSNGNREYSTRIISHPLAASREELFAALKTVSQEADLTKRKQAKGQARAELERKQQEDAREKEERIRVAERKQQQTTEAKRKVEQKEKRDTETPLEVAQLEKKQIPLERDEKEHKRKQALIEEQQKKQVAEERNASEIENNKLKKEIARLKKQNQSKPKQVAKKSSKPSRKVQEELEKLRRENARLNKEKQTPAHC